MIGDPYKDFAQKMLIRYQDKRPFAVDPDAATAAEDAATEKAAEDVAEKKNSTISTSVDSESPEA